MKKFKHIMWDPKYSVNNMIIDAQHYDFFSIFNRTVDLYENGSTDVYSILRELVNLVSKQFHEEDLIMRNTNYPGFLQHSEEHDILFEALHGFLNRHEKHDERLVYDLLNFLNEWIDFHILKADLKYREYPAPVSEADSQLIQKASKPVQELRKTTRISTSIEAYYWKRGSLDIFGKVQKGIILNLSLEGCCLFVPQNHKINSNCNIHLAFILDDKRRTKIEKEAVVCWVTENQIGCKFTPDVHKGDEPELVYYIKEHMAANR
ncbi:MAG: hemerythrin domain-containing protein [Syntrophales bacterium]